MQKLIGVLEKNRLEAILLKDPISRFYATGLSTSAGIVLLTAKTCFFATDFRYIEEAKACRDNFTVVETGTDNPPLRWLESCLPIGAVIGYEAEKTAAAELERMQKALPRRRWEAVDDALMNLRAVKDKDELSAMRLAQAIAEKAFLGLLREKTPEGMSERAVAAELTYRMLCAGADGMSFPPIVVSGANGSKPHGTPSDKIIRRGDFVTMDFGCVKNGYCSDMTRTVAIGTPSGEMRAVYEIVLAAQEAGIAAARAGVPGCEIDKAARAVIEKAGFGKYFGHGFGHGLGLEVHEPPNANAAAKKPLPAGSVISAEPGIYLPGRLGVRIEDTLYLNEQGCENLMSVPKELLVL